MRDLLDALIAGVIAVLIVAVASAPIAYGVWRGRNTAMLAGRPDEPTPWRAILWGSCVVACVMAVGIILGIGGATRDSMLLVTSAAFGVAFWGGVAWLVRRLLRRRQDKV